jgi:hypothetical protein
VGHDEPLPAKVLAAGAWAHLRSQQGVIVACSKQRDP